MFTENVSYGRDSDIKGKTDGEGKALKEGHKGLIGCWVDKPGPPLTGAPVWPHPGIAPDACKAGQRGAKQRKLARKKNRNLLCDNCLNINNRVTYALTEKE